MKTIKHITSMHSKVKRILPKKILISYHLIIHLNDQFKILLLIFIQLMFYIQKKTKKIRIV